MSEITETGRRAQRTMARAAGMTWAGARRCVPVVGEEEEQGRPSKASWHDLAICGGTPAFEKPLFVGRPTAIDQARFMQRVESVLSRGWLTNNGPLVQELEGKICKYLGVRNCVMTCNGTAALEIGIEVLGLTGEVIVPSFTFIATAHALQRRGITPVFCDVDPRTHSLDPVEVERLITPRTTGILGVHLWGRGCDTNALADIARRRRLHMLFDAAHAFGCSEAGRMIGNHGELEVFSFHATKFFHTLEGGAVVTNDDSLAVRLRQMVNFGFAGPEQVACLGTNAKMHEVSAAMGLTGMEGIRNVIAGNRQKYHQYVEDLRDIPGIRLLPIDEEERSNYQYIVIEVDEMVAGISRDELLQLLRAENVMARRYFYPGCHRCEPYKSLYPGLDGRLPVTNRLAQSVLALPTGTSIGRQDVQTVCEIIRLAVQRAADVQPV